MKTLYQSQIEELLLSTGRDGIRPLLTWMEMNGFFHSPASTENSKHLAHAGGLAIHSLNVYKNAVKIAQALGYWEKHENSIIIASILHDLGKTGQYGKNYYIDNVLKGGDVSKAKPYKINDQLLPIVHEIRSVSIAQRFIELTEEEQFAILYHNGMYSNLRWELSGNETELYMVLHWADMWASRVTER